MRTEGILSFLLLLASGQCQPQDWFRSNGTPTFGCDGVGKNATTFSWFQVLFGYLVFPILRHSSSPYYSLRGANLSLPKNHSGDRDFFCEAKAEGGRVWRSRKAQLRFGLGSPAASPALSPLGPLDTPPLQRPFDGDSCHLACAFPERSKAVWIHNGRRVDDGLLRTESKPGKSALYIVRFNSSRHAGVYQCLVSNTGRSWQPLRRPFLIIPSAELRNASELPFFHYEIVTAGELAMNEDNDHAPRITAVRGNHFAVKVNGTGGNVTLTAAIVSDLDRGLAGQINCFVTNSSRNGSRLLFRASSDMSPLIGELVLEASVWPELVRFNLTCSDRGKQKKSATESFKVEIGGSETESSTTTRKLVTLATESLRDKTQDETLLFVRKLKNATNDAEKLSAKDVALASAKTAEVIERMERADTDRNQMLDQVTFLVSNTLKADREVLSSGEAAGGVASQTLNSVGKMLGAIDATEAGREFQSEQLAVGAVRLNRSGEMGREIAFSSRSRRPSEAKISNETAGSVAISVLAEHVVGDRVEFAMFKDAALFKALNRTALNRTLVLSPVISARAVLKRLEQQQAVKLVFSGDNLPPEWDTDAPRFCAFWNEQQRSWDTAGCNSSLEGRATECRCSHLTNFALLLDLDAQPIRREHHLALSFLTYLCLSLSCVALALTMFVYFTYMRRKQASARSGQKSSASAVTRSCVLLALSGSLLVAHFLFLTTSFHSLDGVACKVFALMLHFSYLSVFFWSVVEGINVFLSLIYMALNSGRILIQPSNFFPKAAGIAWSLAFVVVIVTASSTRLGGYRQLHEGSDMSLCFVVGLPFYLGFVLPLALCLCVNLVILALLGFVLMRRTGGMSDKKKSRSKNKAIGFLSVCVTLNTTWAIGLLQMGPMKVAMNYLFVIGNGLQGALIFVCYCVLREEMRSHMAKSVRCLAWMRPAGERRRSEIYSSEQVPLSSEPSTKRALKKRGRASSVLGSEATTMLSEIRT